MSRFKFNSDKNSRDDYHGLFSYLTFLDISISSKYPYSFGNRGGCGESFSITQRTRVENEDENFTHRHVKKKGLIREPA